MHPRRFHLLRTRDVSGISGTGIVADGEQYGADWSLLFPDNTTVHLPPGWCVITWRGETPSLVLWSSVDDAMAVHGHSGATELVWLD